MAERVNSVPLIKVALSGMDKHRFPMPLLVTWCHQTDLPKSKLNTELYIFCCSSCQKCTKLHSYALTFSKNFPGWYSRTPISGEEKAYSPDSSPSACIHCPTFSELLWPLLCRLWFPLKNKFELTVFSIICWQNCSGLHFQTTVYVQPTTTEHDLRVFDII